MIGIQYVIFFKMKRTKQYWIDKLGEEWTMRLRDILKSPYMDKLMNFITLENTFKRINPHSNNIFNAFKTISPQNVKIIIITKEPGINASNFKIPYDDRYIDSIHNASYSKIFECVERQYQKNNYLYLHFDHDFETWAQQGVLHLHTSFTVEGEISGSHLRPWNKFITAVLQSFVEHDPGLIFFLWGEEAKTFSPLLTNQHVFSWECPSTAVKECRDWHCPNFKQADNLMIKLYGERSNYKIKW